jgi:hypothetical protein
LLSSLETKHHRINTAALLDIREEEAWKISAEKATCTFISSHENAEKGSKYFERVVQQKYFVSSVPNEITVHENITSRLRRGMLATITYGTVCISACYPKQD